MFLGALVDAGWDPAHLRRSLEWLGGRLERIDVIERRHGAIVGTGIEVVPGPECTSPPGSSHGHGRMLAHPEQVIDLLRSSPLPQRVKEKSLAVFERLIQAEARVHGKDPGAVHFHEVGALDSVVDIVGTCLGLEDLGIVELYVSPLPVGSGTIEGAHGTIPVPAPATAALLEGVPVRWSPYPGERCTPTGTALVTTLGRFEVPPPMRIDAVGTGAGSRIEEGVPNFARLFVGESTREVADLVGTGAGAIPGDRLERVLELSAWLDDATPEHISALAEDVLADGALDVSVVPRLGKKGRQGWSLTVLCRPEQESRFADFLLEHSPSAGLRRQVLWRRVLERRISRVETPYGQVRVKWVRRPGGWDPKPEMDDCVAVAHEVGVAPRRVWAAALAAALAAGDPGEPAD